MMHLQTTGQLSSGVTLPALSSGKAINDSRTKRYIVKGELFVYLFGFFFLKTVKTILLSINSAIIRHLFRIDL